MLTYEEHGKRNKKPHKKGESRQPSHKNPLDKAQVGREASRLVRIWSPANLDDADVRRRRSVPKASPLAGFCCFSLQRPSPVSLSCTDHPQH